MDRANLFRAAAALWIAGAAALAQAEPGKPSGAEVAWGSSFGPEPPSPTGFAIDWDRQAAAVAAEPRLAAWIAAHPGWRIVLDPATGRPWRAYGPGIPLVPAGADDDATRAAAVDFARALHAALAIPGDPPRLRTWARTDRIRYASFTQSRDGVDADDAGLMLRVDDEGRVVLWGGRLLDLGGAATLPLLDADAAASALRARLRADGLATDATTLVVRAADLRLHASLVASVAAPALAWRLRVGAERPRAEWVAYVDARTGVVREFWNDVRRVGRAARAASPLIARASRPSPRATSRPTRPPATVTATVTGTVHDGVPPHAPPVAAPFPENDFVVGGVAATTDAAGQFVATAAGGLVAVTSALDGPAITTHNAAPGGAQASYFALATSGALAATWSDANSTQAERDVFLFGTRARATLLLRNPLETLFGAPLVANVGVPGSCNAYYDGTSINFHPASAPGPGACVDAAYSDTVVEHEYGHHVTTTIYAAHGRTVPGHLGEGFSDAQASACEDVSVIGEGFQGPGTFVRDLNNTCQWPTSCGTEIHARGKLVGACWWHARALLATSMGAAGKALMDEYLYKHFHGAPQTEIESCLEMLVLDDDDGDLTNGTPRLDVLRQAFTVQHGVPFPIPLIRIVHAPLASSADQYRDYEVRAEATSLLGVGMATGTLRYSVGGGAYVSVAMTNLGAYWKASIPLQPANSIVSYYVRFTDALGVAQNFPAAAPLDAFVFRTYYPTTFFADGFETSSGWTTGATTGVDDWQRQAPGDPFHAYDPPAAAEGSQCFGTDLSPSASWNGLYANNVRTHLTSPVVNCSGRTGVVLSYRRLLTVEDGLYDQARIQVSVGGGPFSTVWQNAATSGGATHHVDGDWVRHVVRLYGADNQPNVRVRFELQTDGSVVFGGWNVDDVRLDAFPTTSITGSYGQLAPGSIAAVLVRARPGDAVVLGADLALAGTYLEGAGTISLDVYGPTFVLLFAPGTAFVPGSGVFALPFIVPSGLSGYTVWFQSAIGPIDGGPLVLGNVHPLTFP